MKTYCLKFLAILALMTTFPMENSLAGNGSGGHAGDPATYPFYRTALKLRDTFRKINHLPGVRFSRRFNVERFADAVNSTFLVSTNDLILVPVPGATDGSQRPAAFKSTRGLITIQRQESAQLAKTDPRIYNVEVIHEYLSQMKFKDAQLGEWDEHSLSEELMQTIEKYADMEIEQHATRLANARNIFKSAEPIHLTTVPALTWNCLEISALPEESIDAAEVSVFRTGKSPSDRKNFRAVRPVGDRNEHTAHATEYVQSWAEIDQDQDSQSRITRLYDAVRVTRTKSLIIERGMDHRFENQLVSQARVGADHGVVSYFYCPFSQNIQSESYLRGINELIEVVRGLSEASQAKKPNKRTKKLLNSLESSSVVFFDMKTGLPETDSKPSENTDQKSMGQLISHNLHQRLRAIDYTSRGSAMLDAPSIDIPLENAYANFFASAQNEIQLLPEQMEQKSSAGFSPLERLEKSLESLKMKMIEDALRLRATK